MRHCLANASSPPRPAAVRRRPAVEQSKSFEEVFVEGAIIRDRAALADPSNSVHQMWEYDSQTALVARAKR